MTAASMFIASSAHPHVWAAESRSEGAMQCMICGGGAKFAFRSPYVQVAKCGDPACGHLFAMSAAPDDGVQSHPDPAGEEARYALRNRRLVEFFAAEGFLAERSRVLDVGAGSGHVSQAIADAFPNAAIACIEADTDARRYLESKGWVAFPSIEVCEGKFESMLLIEVIEHVYDPVDFLRKCAARLAPGGKTFLSTPCGELRNGSHRTSAYETKEHVHFFTERSLRKACAEAGLRAVRYRSVSQLYPRGEGIGGVKDAVKAALRPMRSAVVGHSHLVTFLEHPAP